MPNGTNVNQENKNQQTNNASSQVLVSTNRPKFANYLVIFSLVSTLAVELQEMMSDREITVGEVAKLIEDVVKKLGWENKVILRV